MHIPAMVPTSLLPAASHQDKGLIIHLSLVPQIDPSVKLYNHGEGPYYSHPSFLIFALRTQFHIYLPWDQHPFSIVS